MDGIIKEKYSNAGLLHKQTVILQLVCEWNLTINKYLNGA